MLQAGSTATMIKYGSKQEAMIHEGADQGEITESGKRDFNHGHKF